MGCDSKSGFYCPVCISLVNEFNPLPDYYRDNFKAFRFPYSFEDCETLNGYNYSCPNCGASDRDRLSALYLSRLFERHGPQLPINLIQFAPSQALSQFILQHKCVRYRTADISMKGVDDRVDITAMYIYPAGSFDIFICSHVLEHVADDRKAIAELYRILSPHGQGIIMVPIVLPLQKIDEEEQPLSAAERWRRFGQNDHVRLYSKQGFIDRINDAGFVVHQLGVDYFGAESFDHTGIERNSVLYVVRKKVGNAKS